MPSLPVELNSLEWELLDRYVGINHDPPKWAFDVKPPIPFVGSRFREAPKRVLVYASAENLTYTTKPNFKERPRSWLDLEHQMIRSRVMFSTEGGTNVHIAPIDNGSLLKAARHILHRLNPDWSFSVDSPQGFMDQIAVANPGKFSIDPIKVGMARKKNLDYASDPEKFEEMRVYIGADLQVLLPEIIIVPATIQATLKKLTPPIDLSSGRTVIGIYQIAPQPINRHIKRQLAGAAWVCDPLPYCHWPVSDARLNMPLYLQWLDNHPLLQ